MYSPNTTQGTHTGAAATENRTSQVLVLMTPAERLELELLAKNEHRSLSATARLAIRDFVSQQKAKASVAD